MGITNHWEEIKKDFKVFGLKDAAWHPFELRRDYEAFLIRRR